MTKTNSPHNEIEGVAADTVDPEMKTKDEKAEFSARLNLVLDYLGVPPKQKGRQMIVAKTFGVSQKGASKWLEGEAIPESKRIPQFIEVYKSARITGEWLFHGNTLFSPDWLTGKDSYSTTLKPGPDLKRTVPLLTWSGIIERQEKMGKIDTFQQWVQTTADVGANAFALVVVGDSMANPHGSPSIPEGYTVIADPDVEPVNGSIVIARIDESKEATLKKLVIDGNKRYLKSLNPAYQAIEIDENCTFLGVVKRVSFDL